MGLSASGVGGSFAWDIRLCGLRKHIGLAQMQVAVLSDLVWRSVFEQKYDADQPRRVTVYTRE